MRRIDLCCLILSPIVVSTSSALSYAIMCDEELADPGYILKVQIFSRNMFWQQVKGSADFLIQILSPLLACSAFYPTFRPNTHVGFYMKTAKLAKQGHTSNLFMSLTCLPSWWACWSYRWDAWWPMPQSSSRSCSLRYGILAPGFQSVCYWDQPTMNAAFCGRHS